MESKKDIFHALIASFSIIIVFSIGYFTANLVNFQKPPITVEKLTDNTYFTGENEKLQPPKDGSVVASIHSDKFHFERCSSASRIKEENKIYFASAEEAIQAGFTLAGNCK